MKAMSAGLPPSPWTSTIRWFKPDSVRGAAAAPAASLADAPGTEAAAAPAVAAPAAGSISAPVHDGRVPHILCLISFVFFFAPPPPPLPPTSPLPGLVSPLARSLPSLPTPSDEKEEPTGENLPEPPTPRLPPPPPLNGPAGGLERLAV